MVDYAKFAAHELPHGIMFHHFHGAGHPMVQGSISSDQLADMVTFLGGKRRILDASMWLEKALAGRLEKDDLCLTFDDSLLCQKTVAVPVLKSLGYTGMFFVYSSVFQGGLERLEIYRAFRTRYFENVDAFYDKFFEEVERSDFCGICRTALGGFVPGDYLADFPFYSDSDRTFRFLRDRVLDSDGYNGLMEAMIGRVTSVEDLSQSLWMQNDDLVDLSMDGHIVGLHSHSHPTTLVDQSPTQQEMEYSLNKEHLTSILGVAPQTMSHPCNSYDQTTLDILLRLGVNVGFQASMASPGVTKLEFPREDHSNVLAMMRR